MYRSLILAGAAAVALAAPPALAHHPHRHFRAERVDYHRHHRWAAARAAEAWGRETSAVVPEAAPDEALAPYGSTVIASRPVPDTPVNRDRYGEPLSLTGRLTAPLGD